MRIVTNHGSNLSDAAIRRYSIEITPQQIMVDGVSHETLSPIPLSQIDRWVAEAKEFPYVVGTTAQQYATIFSRLLHADPELIAVMTSKKIIQSYAAATAASRTLAGTPAFANAGIAVVDSKMTDAGTGLLTVAVGEASLAGLGLRRTTLLAESLAARGVFVFVLQSVDYLVKGGRASWVRGWVANFFKIKPLIAFVDGELKSVGKVSGQADEVAAVAEYAISKVGRGRKVWIAIYHGDAPLKAHLLAAHLKQALDVAYVYLRKLSPSIYLNSGAGAVGVALYPMDDLPWSPPVPPDFSD